MVLENNTHSICHLHKCHNIRGERICRYTYVCTCAHRGQRRHGMSYYTTFCLLPFSQGLSMNLKLTWWPVSPSNPPACLPQGWGYSCTQPHQAFFIDMHIRTQFRCNKCSHPLSPLPSPHRNISINWEDI